MSDGGQERDAHDAAGRSVPDPTARARRRGQQLALGLFILVAVAFIGSSTLQITEGVFGYSVTPLPADAPPGSPAQVCATGIHSLALALDRAGRRAASITSVDPARDEAESDAETVAALRPGLSPEWDDADTVARACSRFPEGTVAWASLQRLRVASEQSGRLGREELRDVRRDVSAHLPAELR